MAYRLVNTLCLILGILIAAVYTPRISLPLLRRASWMTG